MEVPVTRLLKVPEVLYQLQISKSHLAKLMRDGRVPVTRLGRSVRIPETAVVQLMEASTED